MITVTVTGLTELEYKLEELPAKLSDLSVPMRTIGAFLVKEFSTSSFNTQGENVGHPWPRLSDSTLTEKKKKWRGRGALIRTGLMQRSFFATATPLTVIVANAQEENYFKYHQSSAPHHKVPRRVMMALTDQYKEMAKKSISDQIHLVLGE